MNEMPRAEGNEVRLDSLQRYVEELNLLPELATALIRLLDEDTSEAEGSHDSTNALISYFLAVGGTDEGVCRSYLVIWRLLVLFASRMDHVQDDDARTVPLPEGASIAAEYNLMMAYYTLILHLLDKVADDGVPLERLQRIRTMWSSSLLIAWSGQQRDLLYRRPTNSLRPSLEFYQQTAQAKSGAFYALGLGGLCALATDNEHWRAVSEQIGMTLGSMIQFRDDIADRHQDEPSGLTLPEMFLASQPPDAPAVPLGIYGAYVWQLYSQHVEALSKCLPPGAQVAIGRLLKQARQRREQVLQ